jgi:1,2-phenylacetyl-CoA epoxidase PaaB subunit
MESNQDQLQPLLQNNNDIINALKEELDHFIKLSQVQAEQLKKYEKLQKRSHQLIASLTDKSEKISWKKSI